MPTREDRHGRVSWSRPLDRSQYLLAKDAPDGRVIAVEPLLLNQGQIVRTLDDELSLNDEEWMYGDWVAAVEAYEAWDGAPGTEPAGWARHKSRATGVTRRREYDVRGRLRREWEDQP